MPILERRQNFGIDSRPHTLGNAFPYNVSSLIDDDLDDDIPFRQSSQIVRIDVGLRGHSGQSGSDIFPGSRTSGK